MALRYLLLSCINVYHGYHLYQVLDFKTEVQYFNKLIHESTKDVYENGRNTRHFGHKINLNIATTKLKRSIYKYKNEDFR